MFSRTPTELNSAQPLTPAHTTLRITLTNHNSRARLYSAPAHKWTKYSAKKYNRHLYWMGSRV